MGIKQTGILMIWLMSAVAWGSAQTPAAKPPAVAPKPALQVTAASLDAVSVKAQDVPLSHITKELERRLHLPIRVSQQMQQKAITLESETGTLAQALFQLAPQVFLDEIVSGGGAEAAPVAAYLFDASEAAPPAAASFAEHHEAVQISGDTDEAEPAAAEPLTVRVKDGLCTIRARHQPLHAVLHLLAEQLAIPFVMPADPHELLDLEISDAPLDLVMRSLPDTVQLYRRTTYPGGASIPLQFVLAPPATESKRLSP